MKSVWNFDVELPHFESLKNNIRTDVLIIGGGIAGILCGYMLKKSDVDCIVVEADRICGGVTQYTTAKITGQHGLLYDKIIGTYGVDTARGYYEAQNQALEKYQQLCKKIDCDFEQCNSYVYSKNDRQKLEKEMEALCKIGCNAEFAEKLPLPFSTVGAVETKNQAQFNPLKFLCEISKELLIYENTKVVELVPGGATTKCGKIKADVIVVATHFPFLNKHGGYFLKLYQHRSYEIALKNADVLKDIYVDETDFGMSFRGYKDMLLIGGGGHRTGKKGGSWNELTSFYQKHYKNAFEVCRWATQDCMSLDKIPYIGRYSKRTPNLYVATGFNKWGMTSSMVAAMLLCDLIKEKQNPYEDVFSPQRRSLHPQLALNGAEAVLSILTPTAPRCPHMGCALKYNKEEHSWDCPCHGSRFTKSGKLINNPATDDKKL